MKKTILILCLLCVFTSLANATAKLSGSISNFAETELLLSGFDTKETILVNKDGTFSTSFEVTNGGLFILSAANQKLVLYFKKDSQLVLHFDYNKVDETLRFDGNVAHEARYLYSKSKIYYDFDKDFAKSYSMEETEFLAKIDEMANQNKILIENSKELSPNFLELELKSIERRNNNRLGSYPIFYSLYTQKSEPKAKLVRARIVKNNEYPTADEFFYSSVFRDKMTGIFSNGFWEAFKKDEAQVQAFITAEAQKINNPTILDYVLVPIVNDYRVKPKNRTMIYDPIISNLTDESAKKELRQRLVTIDQFVKGNPAPSFEFLDHNDQKVSLESLRGKYVYIDVWATWCKPCVAEIPSLKKVEEEFHNQDIAFVSVSIDNLKDKQKWKKFIQDKALKGIQLQADNAWESQFVKDYVVRGVPKFILIDPNGIIVDTDAPRPSDSRLKKILKRLDN
jgi:thiol-disulfide isomerase/thioredoxin